MINQADLENDNQTVSTVVDTDDDASTVKKRRKQPKRILHFSDGTLEEYSTDEDENDQAKQVATVNPATLKWTPWLWYQTSFLARKALGACDFLGESLASFFGILTPKYQSEIDHFKEIQAEEVELKKQDDLEMGSWKTNPTTDDVIDAEVKNSHTVAEKY